MFKAPQYTKIANPKTGVLEPCYTFNVEYNESLTFVANDRTDISLEMLHKTLDNSWWNTFIGAFLESSSKFFSKPYTVEAINKITKHTMDTTIVSTTQEPFPVNVLLVPKSIQIFGGVFTIQWIYNMEQMIIPDLDLPVDEKIEELNIDDLPVENMDTLEIESPSKYYDKQRVKETRLKAKLAVYKAQRQIAEYSEKYGEISDSDTESESDENE
jgi:hypothetical protein